MLSLFVYTREYTSTAEVLVFAEDEQSDLSGLRNQRTDAVGHLSGLA